MQLPSQHVPAPQSRAHLWTNDDTEQQLMPQKPLRCDTPSRSLLECQSFKESKMSWDPTRKIKMAQGISKSVGFQTYWKDTFKCKRAQLGHCLLLFWIRALCLTIGTLVCVSHGCFLMI